ncbi:MAG: HesA/MoeB/ThiF family protein [Methanomicrobia archaeon]|nr:HesA/MoeB/ThiF family protein [Methanomicrobia archaeon]
MTLTNRELTRYDRQIRMQEFGKKGQENLKKAHVVVAGAGGLGSSAGIYLATSGIGHISIIDHEAVELSNLNRQILHWERDIGKSKVESAVEKLRQINSDIEVTDIEKEIKEENVLELLKGADAIVDCMDNFHTRFILNDAALKLNIPFFHGACYGFEGRATTIIPKKTPCLRCIIPKSPPEKKVPIMSTTPGTIGTIQATEVIKFFAGIKPLLTSKLLIYDSWYLTYDLIKIERNRKCPSCGG